MNGFMCPTGDGNKIYDLGTGTIFNVSSINGYKNFTADNFIAGIVNYSISSGWEGTGSTGDGYVNRTLSTSKNYDASTGKFTCSISGGYVNNKSESRTYSANMHVYLVADISKAKKL